MTSEQNATTAGTRPRTLAEKVWDAHVVVPGENGKPDLLYIDLQLLHEVTSPQAFEGLRIEVDTSLPAARVIRALNELVEVRGAPCRFAWTTAPSSSPMPCPNGRNPRALLAIPRSRCVT